MRLRPMTMEDADFMLKLKNYPETRTYSIFSHNEIEKESHLQWLEKNIGSMQTIDDKGNLCGAVRIENNEISIWIDRDCRNKGIAKFFLAQITESGMIARIVNGNIASMRAFIYAGFKPVSYEGNYYIFKK